MTQQFKFGDKVQYKEKFGFVLHHSSNVYVAWQDGSQSTIAANKLSITPHPDTVRLDYIQNRLPEIRLVECNEAGAVAFCLTRKNGFVCTNTLSPSIRETIDNAMQEQTP